MSNKNWFAEMSENQQAQYLKEHPNSRLAKQMRLSNKEKGISGSMQSLLTALKNSPSGKGIEEKPVKAFLKTEPGETAKLLSRTKTPNSNETRTEWGNSEGKLHKDFGPAVTVYEHGKPVLEEFYKNGVKHREEGPAVVRYAPKGEYTWGSSFYEEFYSEGKLHNIFGPAIVETETDCGATVEEKYFLNGCEVTNDALNEERIKVAQQLVKNPHASVALAKKIYQTTNLPSELESEVYELINRS